MRWFEPYKERLPTKAELRQNLVEQLGAGIIARRMQGFSDEAGRPARVVGSASPAGGLVALACAASYACSGHQGIYRAQRLEAPKHRPA